MPTFLCKIMSPESIPWWLISIDILIIDNSETRHISNLNLQTQNKQVCTYLIILNKLIKFNNLDAFYQLRNYGSPRKWELLFPLPLCCEHVINENISPMIILFHLIQCQINYHEACILTCEIWIQYVHSPPPCLPSK